MNWRLEAEGWVECEEEEEEREGDNKNIFVNLFCLFAQVLVLKKNADEAKNILNKIMILMTIMNMILQPWVQVRQKKLSSSRALFYRNLLKIEIME